MTGSINNLCITPRCPNKALPGRPRCEQHDKNYNKLRREENAQVLSLMRGRNWQRTKDYIIACGNRFCQRVDADHFRCRNVGVILHHIIPNNLAAQMGIFYDQNNLVMCCKSCHPSKDHKDQGQFVPTVWADPGSSDPVPEPICQPGHRVKDASKLWSVRERMDWFRKKG
jgi:5-methylcytosine-specific restriction endonuclease McrA